MITDNSKLIKGLLSLYKKSWKKKMISYSRTSLVMNSVGGIKNKIHSLPIKTMSIILVPVILINILFFNQEISLSGWIARGLFLFMGLAGLFCEVDYETLKKGSFVLRRFIR